MHEFAAPGSAPAVSEGTGCGKEFFCVSPGEHLPCVPSHCLRSTGFIPLLSLANHAQKHTRRACAICSSSVYCREHLVLQTHLCLQHLLCPEQQLFPPGMTSCLIQTSAPRAAPSIIPAPLPLRRGRQSIFIPLRISSSVPSTVTVWLKFFSQSHCHKGSLRDFTVYFSFTSLQKP